MVGNCDNKERDLNCEHPFPTVLGYNRSGVKELILQSLECTYIEIVPFCHVSCNGMSEFDIIPMVFYIEYPNQ